MTQPPFQTGKVVGSEVPQGGEDTHQVNCGREKVIKYQNRFQRTEIKNISFSPWTNYGKEQTGLLMQGSCVMSQQKQQVAVVQKGTPMALPQGKSQANRTDKWKKTVYILSFSSRSYCRFPETSCCGFQLSHHYGLFHIAFTSCQRIPLLLHRRVPT